ncbi:TaqI-like C-terminal specificity domain-containing protein [Clostridium sp. JNZ X4-2]
MKKQQEPVVLGKVYEKSMDREERKEKGSFYTPHCIVDYIVENIISDLDVKKNPFVKILDPSCGSGYFLIKVYEVLMKKFSENLELLRYDFKDENYRVEDENGIKYIKGMEYWQYSNLSYHILKECIYGADIDGFAVKLAKINLYNKSGINLNLKHNIVCCNSLIKWERGHGEKEGKGLEPEDIGEFWRKKYDYILGNPPWISLSRKYKKNIKDKLMDYYNKNYGGNTYLPNLYEYFMKRSMELLKPHGRFGFIIPDRLASNLYYKDFRKKLLENYNILNLVFEIKFPEVNADSMIIIAENSYESHNRVKIDICKKRIYTISQQQYLKNLNFEFSYCYNIKGMDIKECIEKRSRALSDICSTFTGFIGYSSKMTSNKIHLSQVKVLKGENIRKFEISGSYYYDFIPENIKGGTKNVKKLAGKNKILIRKTGKSLTAALDSEGCIIEQSLYGVISKNKEVSVYYILGILNSTLIQWYYLNFLITNPHSTPQIKKYSLDQIPIYKCNLQDMMKVEKLVCKIMCKKQERTVLAKELDEIVFGLYNIDYRHRHIIVDEVESSRNCKKSGWGDDL